MNHRVVLWAVLAVVFAFGAGQAVSAAELDRKLSIDFTNADIRDVFKLLGEKAGCNVITEKAVRGNVTVKAKDVPVQRLARQIAEANGFFLQIEGNTMLLTDERKLPVIRVTRQLRHMSAGEAAKAVISAMTKDVRVAVVEDTNRLIISARAHVVQDVEKLLASIDQPRPDMRALVQLKQGGAVIREFACGVMIGRESQMEWVVKQIARKEGDKPLRMAPDTSSIALLPDFIDEKGRVHGALTCKLNLPAGTDARTAQVVRTGFVAEPGTAVTVARLGGSREGFSIVLTVSR
ncbi:MAG TPA: secretin N-terminal domain-containing protein [Candidatus Ozemobacteraceae bacterium]|nr:secretin N-terminal domain-containing protein [Candidatus Ozemobacteraceae bacterium]